MLRPRLLLRERGLVVDDYPGYRPGPDDPDYYLSYKSWKREWASDTNFMVKRVLLGAYARMFGLFPPDLPDDQLIALFTAAQIAVAEAVRVLILEDVPRLSSENYNEAKRFVTLIDALYEAGVRLRKIILFMVILPLLLSVVIRTFAWIAILSREGVSNATLQSLGLTSEPISLLQTEFGLILSLMQKSILRLRTIGVVASSTFLV